MICADARHLIHLDAGGDLPLEEEHSLAEHMGKCSECRAYNAGMLKAMGALHVLRDFDSCTSQYATMRHDGSAERPVQRSARPDSVWSDLSQRLPARKPATGLRRQFNTRVAALCACSLVLAVVSIVQNLPVTKYSTSNYYNMPGQLSSYSPQSQFGQPASPVTGGEGAFSGNSFPVMNPDGSIAGYLQLRGNIPQSNLPIADVKASESF